MRTYKATKYQDSRNIKIQAHRTTKFGARGLVTKRACVENSVLHRWRSAANNNIWHLRSEGWSQVRIRTHSRKHNPLTHFVVWRVLPLPHVFGRGECNIFLGTSNELGHRLSILETMCLETIDDNRQTRRLLSSFKWQVQYTSNSRVHILILVK
jgi:hypothetical protein